MAKNVAPTHPRKENVLNLYGYELSYMYLKDSVVKHLKNRNSGLYYLMWLLYALTASAGPLQIQWRVVFSLTAAYLVTIVVMAYEKMPPGLFGDLTSLFLDSRRSRAKKKRGQSAQNTPPSILSISLHFREVCIFGILGLKSTVSGILNVLYVSEGTQEWIMNYHNAYVQFLLLLSILLTLKRTWLLNQTFRASHFLEILFQSAVILYGYPAEWFVTKTIIDLSLDTAMWTMMRVARSLLGGRSSMTPEVLAMKLH